eukprot:403368200
MLNNILDKNSSGIQAQNVLSKFKNLQSQRRSTVQDIKSLGTLTNSKMFQFGQKNQHDNPDDISRDSANFFQAQLTQFNQQKNLRGTIKSKGQSQFKEDNLVGYEILDSKIADALSSDNDLSNDQIYDAEEEVIVQNKLQQNTKYYLEKESSFQCSRKQIEDLEYPILYMKFPKLTEKGTILHELIDSLIKRPQQTLQFLKMNSKHSHFSQHYQNEAKPRLLFSREGSSQTDESLKQELFDLIHRLMTRPENQYSFPTGHFAKMCTKVGDNRAIQRAYIEQRFYVQNEIQFNFWFLIYTNQTKLAGTLAENEKGSIDPFLDILNLLMGGEELQKLSQHILNQKIVKNPHGLKWGLKEAVKLKLDKFVEQEIKKNRFLLRDQKFIQELKQLSVDNNCINLMRYLYQDFLQPDYYKTFYQEEIIKHPYGEIKHFIRKYDAKINPENINIVDVYHRKILKIESKLKEFNNKQLLQQLEVLKKQREKLNELRALRQTLEAELLQLITIPQFLDNGSLTSHLKSIKCFYIIPHLIKERIQKKDCIENKSIFITDFDIFLQLWDKFNFQIMHEISLKLLESKSNLQALMVAESQKNIIKIILVRVYVGAELLSHINIQKWNKDLNKDLLNAIEQHCKDPSQIIYSHRPILTICLVVEFIQKLMRSTNRHKNKCRGLILQLLSMGGKFIKEIKDYDMIKFYVQQQDSKHRSALEIMSQNHFYQLLESNQMAMIIKEMWHGPSAQSFKTYEMSSTFRIVQSKYEQDEAKRRFSPFLKDRKSYLFQYYIWPESCSIRYNAHVIFILVVALLYTFVIYYGIDQNIFDKLEEDPYIDATFKIILVWVSSFFFGNIMDIIYQVVTKRKIRIDFNLILDILLLLGILIQIINVPKLFQTYNEKREDRMHMLVVMINFLILFLLWIVCSAIIFTAMFYKESEQFSSYYDSLINLYNGGLTNFDNQTLFTNNRTKWWGSLFFISYIAITAIFLLNMIIAVLTNVYARTQDKIEADHNAYLVYAYSGLRFDRKYGLLIFSQAPFNLLSFTMMPALLLIYFCTNEKTIIRVNKIFYLVFLPIAYVKGFILFPLQGNNKAQCFIYLILWILFGPFILAWLLVCDAFKYWFLVYQKPHLIQRRKKKNITKQDLMKYQRAEDIKEQSNMDSKQRFSIFIDRFDLIILSRTLKITNDKFMQDIKHGENQYTQMSQNTQEKVLPLAKLFGEWKQQRQEQVKRDIKKEQAQYVQDETDNLHVNAEQILLNQRIQKMKEEKEQRELMEQQRKQKELLEQQQLRDKMMQSNVRPSIMQSKTENIKARAQTLFMNAMNTMKTGNTIKPSGLNPILKTVTALTQFSGNSGKQIEKAQQIQNVGQNFAVLVQMNKETMYELLIQLSNLDDLVDIDKLRKVVYDENVINQMSEEDFEEYRQRLFNTNLTFFEKAIEKSKNRTTNNLIEIQYANEIGLNLELMRIQFTNLKQKLRRIDLFMSCVNPDAITVNENKLEAKNYQYIKESAHKVIHKHQKRKEEIEERKKMEENQDMEQQQLEELEIQYGSMGIDQNYNTSGATGKFRLNSNSRIANFQNKTQNSQSGFQ